MKLPVTYRRLEDRCKKHGSHSKKTADQERFRPQGSFQMSWRAPLFQIFNLVTQCLSRQSQEGAPVSQQEAGLAGETALPATVKEPWQTEGYMVMREVMKGTTWSWLF